jgi:dTDP-4-amino-4,6-dideoxygalactose transaminase
VENIPLSKPWFGDEEAARMREALAGRTAGDGPFCRKVEKALAERLGVQHVLLTTSCTHALELALLALGVGPGQEVVCPSFTFVSTANAVLRVGARPVFADIEETTLGLDPADAERRLSPRTAALLPVHYGSVACDMPRLLELARARNLFVVEDAAQALGASLDGRALGSLGDAGAFSFHETKNVSCGEGGALAIRDPAVARRAEIIREKGTNRSAFLRGEVDKYTWVSEGSSYVLSDLLAALLFAQLGRFDEIHARRAAVSQRYREALGPWADRNGVRLFPDLSLAGRRYNDHVFCLLFPDPGARDHCIQFLRSRGVGATFHYVPLHSSPHARSFGLEQQLPVTDRIAERLLRLPLYALLTGAELERVVEAILESAV